MTTQVNQYGWKALIGSAVAMQWTVSIFLF